MKANHIEAMKLALEALEEPHPGIRTCFTDAITYREKVKQAITALREALANEALDKMAENARELGLDYEPAQQEPDNSNYRLDPPGLDPLYASPPAQRQARSADTWVGLTFAEICECENDYLHIFARAIEAKLKEKNT